MPELCSSVTLESRMGLAKANELLLLGKKIDARTALGWNLCSRIVEDVDSSGDPFHPNSLASQMCHEIDRSLLSLPLGETTSNMYVSMVRGYHKQKLQSACIQELAQLDERFDSGQVAQAAASLGFGGKKTNQSKQKSIHRSKL